MKTIISSVGFQDEGGNFLVNGSIILTLAPGVYRISSGGGQVVGRSAIISLDATAKVPAGIQIWATDELNTQPTYYATLCRNSDGTGPVASVKWSISGISPIDLSTLSAV